MIEYKQGCILVLKEVCDFTLIIWGKNYVVETNEYRITKRLQKGKNENYVTACSSNQDTYKDGRLIHEPIDVPLERINRLFIVLGCVIKQTDGTMVNINK